MENKLSEICHRMNPYPFQNQLGLIKAFSINKSKKILTLKMTYFIYKFLSKMLFQNKEFTVFCLAFFF